MARASEFKWPENISVEFHGYLSLRHPLHINTTQERPPEEFVGDAKRPGHWQRIPHTVSAHYTKVESTAPRLVKLRKRAHASTRITSPAASCYRRCQSRSFPCMTASSSPRLLLEFSHRPPRPVSLSCPVNELACTN